MLCHQMHAWVMCTITKNKEVNSQVPRQWMEFQKKYKKKVTYKGSKLPNNDLLVSSPIVKLCERCFSLLWLLFFTVTDEKSLFALATLSKLITVVFTGLFLPPLPPLPPLAPLPPLFTSLWPVRSTSLKERCFRWDR